MTGKAILGSIIKLSCVMFYGCVGSVGLLFNLIRNGPSKFFHHKLRETRPICMNDPALGEHGILELKKAGIRIHYVAAGDLDKPLMLFLHGFPECWYVWRHQIKAFKNKYRVVAIDLRGYGESDCPSDMFSYALQTLRDDIHDVIVELGYSSCVLVSHDWGGVIAWRVAMDYPDVIDKLIVANAAYPERLKEHLTTHLSQCRKSWYLFFFQIPYLSELMLNASDYQFLDDCFRPAGKTPMCTADDLEAMKFSFSQTGTVTAALNYYRASAKVKPMKSKKVDCPTLLIWGKNDEVLEVEMAKGTEKYVENVTLEIIDGASHWVPLEAPDQFNRLMSEFLEN